MSEENPYETSPIKQDQYPSVSPPPPIPQPPSAERLEVAKAREIAARILLVLGIMNLIGSCFCGISGVSIFAFMGTQKVPNDKTWVIELAGVMMVVMMMFCVAIGVGYLMLRHYLMQRSRLATTRSMMITKIYLALAGLGVLGNLENVFLGRHLLTSWVSLGFGFLLIAALLQLILNLRVILNEPVE